MRITLLLVFFFAGLSSLFAQDRSFRAFRVDLNYGYALASKKSINSNGLSGTLEAKYAFDDFLSIGLRFETTALPTLTLDSFGDYYDNGEVRALRSTFITGDYHFNTNSLRPFLGVGVGFYGSEAYQIQNDMITQTTPSSGKFGFMGRGGFDFWHLRLAAEYNYAGKVDGQSNNYLSLKLGFFFGGGRLD